MQLDIAPEEAIRNIISTKKSLQQAGGTNEARTRLVIINQVLTQVLGWSISDLNPEEYLPTTSPTKQISREWLDYHAKDASGARLVVEAKRLGNTFDFPSVNKARKVSTKALLTNYGNKLADAVRQAISYSRGVGTSCYAVSNGDQWVISASFVEGIESETLSSIVFYSLEDIQENLGLFIDLLSPEGMSKQIIFTHVVEGLAVRPEFAKSINDELRPVEPEKKNNYLVAPMERLMSICFRDLVSLSHQQMLEYCYVTTDVSESDLLQLETFVGSTLPYRVSVDAIDRQSEVEAPLSKESFLAGRQTGESVLVVGKAGSGKSTFLAILRQRLEKSYGVEGWVLLYVDLKNRTQRAASQFSHDRLIDAICKDLLHEAERKYTALNPHAYENLQEIFAGELRRLRSSMPSSLREGIEFDRRSDSLIQTHIAEPESHLKAYLGFLARRGVPATIFLDNVDQGSTDFERVVFQLAQSLNQNTGATVVTTLRDTTYEEASVAGFLDVARHTRFAISPPPFSAVIERRLNYARSRLNADSTLYRQFQTSLRGTPENRVFEFVEILSEMILARGSEVQSFIQNIIGTNIRAGLSIVEEFCVSPHTNMNRLFSDYSAKRTNQPLDPFVHSLMRGKHMRYSESGSRVLNLFHVSRSTRFSHFLSIRVLQFLHETCRLQRDERDVRVGDVVNRCAAAGYPIGILECVNRLGKAGLIISRSQLNPPWSVDDLIEIGSAGTYYLQNLLKNAAYLKNLTDDTIVYSHDDHASMLSIHNLKDIPWNEKYDRKLRVLLAYLWRVEQNDPLKLQGAHKVAEDLARKRIGSDFVDDLKRGSKKGAK